MTNLIISKIISTVQDYTNIPVPEKYKSEGDLLIDYFADAEGLSYSEVLIGMKMKGYHYNYEQRQALGYVLNEFRIGINPESWGEVNDEDVKLLQKNKFSEQTINRLKEAATNRRLSWIQSQIESDEVSIEEKTNLIYSNLRYGEFSQINSSLKKFLATITSESSLQNNETSVEWSEEIEDLSDTVYLVYLTLAQTEKEKAIELAYNTLLTSQNFFQLDAAYYFLRNHYSQEFSRQWDDKPYDRRYVEHLLSNLRNAESERDQLEAMAKFDALNLNKFSDLRSMEMQDFMNIERDVYERYSNHLLWKELFESKNPGLNLVAIRSLSEAGYISPSLPQLNFALKLTENPNPFVRREAFWRLARFSLDRVDNKFVASTNIIDIITKGLNDKDPYIRTASQDLIDSIYSDASFLELFRENPDFKNLMRSMISSVSSNSCEGVNINYEAENITNIFRNILDRYSSSVFEYEDYELDIINLLLNRLENPNDIIDYDTALDLLNNVNLEFIPEDEQVLYYQVQKVQTSH